MSLFRIAILWIFFSLLFSCTKDDPRPVSRHSPLIIQGDMPRQWIDFHCSAIKETQGFFPTQASRALGYMGITLYESLVPAWSEAPSLAGQIQGLEEEVLPKLDYPVEDYHWGIVVNAAAAEMSRRIYGENLSLENKEKISLIEGLWFQSYRSMVKAAQADRSVRLGKAYAEAIYQYASKDGAQDSHLDPFEHGNAYPWPTWAGAWVPTSPVHPYPLSPRWQNNRSFLPSSMIEECQPESHPEFSIVPGSDFHSAALKVYNGVKNHTPEQELIARYWADDPFITCTPSGHTFNILTQLLEEHQANLALSAMAYAQLGIAENDVFIACWRTKYEYFLIRPVTYIRDYIDPDFNTLILTPPFPAYTSGHASEAAAGEVIFTHLFTNGSGRYSFTDRSQMRYGFLPRKYNSFKEISEECAISRLYGGIHYEFDNSLGLFTGRAIGAAVIREIKWPTHDFSR
jgi:hypothetical protein